MSGSIDLSLGVRISRSAEALLRSAQKLDDTALLTKAGLEDGHIGAEPVLYALSMELALKAWWVFDHNSKKVPRTHDLGKLFDKLHPSSRDQLRSAFRAEVAPYQERFFMRYEIDDVLRNNADLFVTWRYLHELTGTLSFDRTLFESTLVLVLTKFKKRYCETPAGRGLSGITI